jgi:anaerobic ribonucleoside-triphosphate reductase
MRRQNSGEKAMESKAGIKVKTEVYSRISGYYRPVVQWNKAKQAEFKERKDLHFFDGELQHNSEAAALR